MVASTFCAFTLAEATATNFEITLQTPCNLLTAQMIIKLALNMEEKKSEMSLLINVWRWNQLLKHFLFEIYTIV